MKPSMIRYCAFISCPNTSASCLDKNFYTFPLDEDRCKKWIKNARRTDLIDKHPAQLYRNFYLCSDHFERSVIQSFSRRGRLKPDAIPTKFDYCLSDSSKSRGKRKSRATHEKSKRGKTNVSSSTASTDAEDQDLDSYFFAEKFCKVEINEAETESITAADSHISDEGHSSEDFLVNCKGELLKTLLETPAHFGNQGKTTKQDKWAGKTKGKDSLTKQAEELRLEVVRLQIMEQMYAKLKIEQATQSVNFKQTIAKLKGKLQYEVQVGEKWKDSLEKWKDSLQKLGLQADDLDNPESFFERLLSNPDVMKALTQKIIDANCNDSCEKSSNEELKACSRVLQTQVSALESERSVLRGTCAQLSVEKEEAVKNLNYFKENYDRLLRDQISLEKLQEQLVSKNEELSGRWRVSQRAFNDLQAEARSLREEVLSLKKQVKH